MSLTPLGALGAVIAEGAAEAYGDRREIRVRDDDGTTDTWAAVDPREEGLDADEAALVWRRESDGLMVETEIDVYVRPVRTLAEAARAGGRRRKDLIAAARQLREDEEAARANGLSIYRDGQEPAWVTEALKDEGPS